MRLNAVEEHCVALDPNVTARTGHQYLLCGLQTLSDIPITGVPTSNFTRHDVDVVIRIVAGNPPIEKGLGSTFEHSAERSLMRVVGVADFEVKQGRAINIWPAAEARQKDIGIFLFGPAWATLCHQRGILPLHASAIVVGERIAAFVGHSGMGKSTTAALLSSSDYALMADDILPVTFNVDSLPGAWPYLRRLKLKTDSISELGLTPTEYVGERLDRGKQFVRPKCAANDSWRLLDRIYQLEVDPAESRISIDRLAGAEAVRVLIDQTYHFKFIIGASAFREHLTFCTKLASKVAIYRMRRSPSFPIGNELYSIIRSHLDNGSK